MSALRARCPDCRTFTAVAVGDGYECHRCGRSFAAGLVRVPRAWGSGGEAMAEAAGIALPYPEAAIVERDALDEQSSALADILPARPVVVGGCCCAHVGAVRGLARRYGRLWRQGIPYNTLMLNCINHPDYRGMRIFADALMELFP